MHAQSVFSTAFSVSTMEKEISQLLNLNANDRSKLGDLVAEYLAIPWQDDDVLDPDGDDSEDEFDPSLSTCDSVLQNDECQMYCGMSEEDVNSVEWEKISKFRYVCKILMFTCLLFVTCSFVGRIIGTVKDRISCAYLLLLFIPAHHELAESIGLIIMHNCVVHCLSSVLDPRQPERKSRANQELFVAEF